MSYKSLVGLFDTFNDEYQKNPKNNSVPERKKHSE